MRSRYAGLSRSSLPCVSAYDQNRRRAASRSSLRIKDSHDCRILRDFSRCPSRFVDARGRPSVASVRKISTVFMATRVIGISMYGGSDMKSYSPVMQRTASGMYSCTTTCCK